MTPSGATMTVKPARSARPASLDRSNASSVFASPQCATTVSSPLLARISAMPIPPIANGVILHRNVAGRRRIATISVERALVAGLWHHLGMTAGYSGTPLAKKLGLNPGMRTWFHAMPDSVRDEIGLDGELIEQAEAVNGLDAAHIFVTERAVLERQLTALRHLIHPAGQVWVSWPKRASKVPTDITEDTIRELALPIGLVDVKVCAVDNIWSGLKLVIRRELRA